MRIRFVVSLGIAVTIAMPGIADAQAAWSPGSEIVGQPVEVTTNGVTNTIYLDQTGAARFLTPGGSAVPGKWTAANGQLCLSNGTAQECWPYRSPFQAGQAVTLTSSCNATSTWLATSTNASPAAVNRSERGR